MIRIALAILASVLVFGCSRPAAPALVEYRDEQWGFTVRHPSGWVRAPARMPGEIRFVPPQTAGAASAEFISIFTVPSVGGTAEASLRRIVFSLLPIHGVSGFQQDPRTTPEATWFKFEVTGSSEQAEWASVGVAVGGSARTQVAICAKPLPEWRKGQQQCDEVIRSFQPGPLTTP